LAETPIPASGTDPSFEAAVRLLSQPATYPERPTQVLVRETHISCVFLTDQYAYKLKKPVKFEFVDFSTPEARRAACEDELRLNRRLAADVYLDIVPLTRQADGTLRLRGSGRVVDWLVQMRRLPEDRMLDQLIASGRLRAEEVDRLARFLTDFYQQAPPLTLPPEEYRAAIEGHVRANRDELLAANHGLPSPLVKRVQTTQLLFLKSCSELLDSRARSVIEGHGDLRPEHVCLEDPPAVFDCVEFSAELRRLDVLDELCFFAMECEFLDADWVGRRVLEVYRQERNDNPPQALLCFYKCYRACVRAKVAALRSRQLGAAADQRPTEALKHARRYLELARGYADALSRPFLIIVRGIMGSGKTTLASQLSEALDVPRLGTDDIRHELFGASAEPAPYNTGHYTPQARQQVYDEIFTRSERLLEACESAVLDGTFLALSSLKRFQELAERHGGQFLVVTCRCSDGVARERIAARLAQGDDSSEARPEFLDRQQLVFEGVPRDVPSLEIDTSEGLPAAALAQICRRLMADGLTATRQGSAFVSQPDALP
jgi:aminoglycoside phosphotransferase family enzyme/predicted kinase